jgi:hypothetical protein
MAAGVKTGPAAFFCAVAAGSDGSRTWIETLSRLPEAKRPGRGASGDMTGTLGKLGENRFPTVLAISRKSGRARRVKGAP